MRPRSFAAPHKLRHWANVLDATRDLVKNHKSQLEDPEPEGHPAAFAEGVVREALLALHFEVSKEENASDVQTLLLLDQVYLQAFSHGILPSGPSTNMPTCY